MGLLPSKESRAVLGLAQVRTTEQPRTAQGERWEELRAPHQNRSWGGSLYLRALTPCLLSTSKYISAGFFVLSVFMEKVSNKLESFKRKDKEEKGRRSRDMDWQMLWVRVCIS